METAPSPDYEAELRQRITREKETEEAERQSQEDALEAESVKLDHEIEQEIRGTLCHCYHILVLTFVFRIDGR